jgi:predicted nucleic acid-binding protein
MPSVIVSDTSCLILFNNIGELELLKKLFGTIHVSETVLKEFNQPVPAWFVVVKPKTDMHRGLSSYLDPGEATAIALAAEHKHSLLIIDEVKGRRVAKELEISVTGSLGVLVAAKKKGHIKAVRPIIEKIRKTNFRVSEDLIKRVLEKADEA